MLGRLRMTIEECIDAYTDLSKVIFTPKHTSLFSFMRGVEYVNGDGKFDSSILENEIRSQIRRSKVAQNDDQILLQDSESPCKVCVFAVHESNSEPAILRTYDYPNAGHTLFGKCKVWEACRATSAAPTFFDPIEIGSYKQRFIDDGLGSNNPILKVYDEAQNIWPNRMFVTTSIGTGVAPSKEFGRNLINIAQSIADIVTRCDGIADEFFKANKDMEAEDRYFRFSVDSMPDIGLDEHEHIRAIADSTEVYLGKGE